MTFGFDLASNRLSMAKDQGSDASVDETTAYVYDANDRLTSETKDAVNNADDRHTVYTYEDTTQTGKTVHDGLDDTATVLETHTFAYDAMGRMTKATVVKGGTTTVTDYVYNHAGFRVKQTVAIDGGTPVVTEYLADANNHTGYTQVLEERVDGILHRTFTLGHDVLTQADTAAVATGAATHHLLYDGHGSTRAVLDAAAAFVQRYAYTAYGVMLDNATLTTAASAVTSLLYSGEWTNANGVQYLRARWYDPVSGRFNRLDPHDTSDPIALHKYLYAHANPVMRLDPSGLFSFIEILSVVGIRNAIQGIYDGTVSVVGAALETTIYGVQARQSANGILLTFAAGLFIGAALGPALGLASRAGGAVIRHGANKVAIPIILEAAEAAQKFIVPALARPAAAGIRSIPTHVGYGRHLFNSGTLKGNLLTTLGKTASDVANYAAHHIISKSLASHKLIRHLRLDLDDAFNGIFLSKTNPWHHGGGNHRGYRLAMEDAFNRIWAQGEKIIDPVARNQFMFGKVMEVRDVAASALWKGGVPLEPGRGGTREVWESLFQDVAG